MTAEFGMPTGRAHMAELNAALDGLADSLDVVTTWGRRCALVCGSGGRLLVAGNGGSAAQAQHLTAELVGRFQLARRPVSAIALHAETSSLTAIVNDFGVDEMYARQVEAHGRRGDVLVVLSTSGKSRNLVHAVERARDYGLLTFAMTGAGPNTLANLCDDAVMVPSKQTAIVQEAHLVAVHLLCAAIEEALVVSTETASRRADSPRQRRVPA